MKAGLERASLFFAVFVSGAVLLGVEIASSRVLAPFFGNSLYVWGALIGVVLDGPRDRLLARRRARRPLPAAWLLLAMMALGALLVLAIPYVDDRVLEWVVDWDPGAAPRTRSSPRSCSSALTSVVLASVTPIAVRLRARASRRSADGRPAVRGLDRREHRRDVRDRVLARFPSSAPTSCSR